MLVHGPAGSGKSTLGVSGPRPRLLMDVEGSGRFIRQKKVRWDPHTQDPPVDDGSWDLCIVNVKDWATAEQTYKHLKRSQHPFKSVTIDSISETQVKGMEAINGRNQFQTQHWGKLLQNMGGLLRDLRDIANDPDNPVEMMTLISTSIEDKGIIKPYLQGSIKSQVPYLFDITAYLYVDQVADANGEVVEKRHLFSGNNPAFEAKSRVPDLPATIPDPNLEVILKHVHAEYE